MVMQETPGASNATAPAPPERRGPRGTYRRKACELCFKKKIKCDMLKPKCSNCCLYQAECRSSLQRRGSVGPARGKPALSQQQALPAPVESVEARLERVERQLQQVLDAIRIDRNAPRDTIIEEPAQEEEQPQDADRALTVYFSPTEPALFQDIQLEDLRLPPLEEILPAIEHYFNVSYVIVPLFDQLSFMQMLNRWYNQPATRNKITWAAIQTVVAMGLRTPVNGVTDSNRTDKARYYLRNVQTVVSDLVGREEDLLGLRILLGLIGLFQNSSNQNPASVLIGAAMRLAHRLRLHARDSAQYFSEDEVRQREQLFWIAYTTDKEISLRMLSPSFQSDSDIDVPLPPLEPPLDSCGLMWTLDGQVYFNFYRMRVDLANIQGKIYDLLYSNRSSKIGLAERQKRIAHLQALLDRWHDRIPPEFQIKTVASSTGPMELIPLTKLHHSYLLCVFMTNGVCGHDPKWVNFVGTISSSVWESRCTDNGGCNLNPSAGGMAALPEAWAKCVEMSRDGMQLFQDVSPTDCLIWQCNYPLFSGLLILIVNMLLQPTHSLMASDQALASKAVKLLDRLHHVARTDTLTTLRLVISDLYEKANTLAIRAAEDMTLGGGLSQHFAAELDFVDFPEAHGEFMDSVLHSEQFAGADMSQRP